MNINLQRFLNLLLDLLLWISVWGIVDNTLSLFKLRKKEEIYIYMGMFLFAIACVYLVNGSFVYKNTLYDG